MGLKDYDLRRDGLVYGKDPVGVGAIKERAVLRVSRLPSELGCAKEKAKTLHVQTG